MSSVALDDAALLAARPTAELGRARAVAIGLAIAGIAGCAMGAMTNHPIFAQAYLIAFIFWTGITVGSLAILMVQFLSGGLWGLLARRVLEASARTWPLLVLLFLPIAFHLEVLYPWARPEAASDPVLVSKAAYLNRDFFFARAALYFAIWGGLTYFLTGWSTEQDGEPTRLPGPKDGRMRMLSGPGLVLYMITVTFSAVDWVMSGNPHFSSTIFGILTLGQQGLSTMAFTVLILSLLVRAKPVSEVARAETFSDLGNLMLAFVMLWAYFNVSQLIIIYQGNLPDEIPWYLNRMYGAWAPIAILVLLGHFVVPFLLLLWRDLKRTPGRVAWLALFILVMRVIDTVWTIAPMHRPNGPTVHWLDFAAVFAIGGIWLTFFFYNLGGRSLVPARDPYFKEALAHVDH
jgi:hypothetical protein